MFSGFGKILMIFGGLMVLLGLLLMLGEKIPFLGRLPGDFTIKGKNYTICFPLVTSLILSLIVTVILNLFGKK